MQEALSQRVPPAEVTSRAAAYFRVLEDAGDVIIELDANGKLTQVSPSIESVLGYTPEATLGLNSAEWIHPEDRDDLVEQFAKLFAAGGSTHAACRLRHRDGHWKMFEIIASPYPKEDASRMVVVHLRDVTVTWEAEKALSTTRERYHLLDRMSQDVVLLIIDHNTKLIWANTGLTNLTGYTAADFTCGDDFSEKVHPDDRKRSDATWYEGLNEPGDVASRAPYRFRIKDGSYRWFEGSDRVYETEQGELQYLSVMRDVTQTRHALEDLRESEERYRLIDELNHDTILLQRDQEGRLLWANSALHSVLAYTKEDVPTAEIFFSKVHPDDLERVTAVLADGYAEVGQTLRYDPYRIRHKNGSWRWIAGIDTLCESDSGERWTISAMRDVTDEIQAEEDRRRLSAQVNETQRLESLGVMAGGIAHDFNNLLTPIVGEAALALLDLPSESPLRRPLTMIQNAAHRAAALTNQMLAYSGQGPRLIEAIDLSALVEEMGQLLESAVSGGAVVTYSLAKKLPELQGDSAQLSQIIMNLITNATEALGNDGGQISVLTGTMDPGEVDRDLIVGDRQPGEHPYVFLEVADDGCGMEAKTRSRIFDPFFTTKFTGRGLGLASVVGIVRGHNGLILLDTEVGRGTRFQVLLPVARGHQSAKEPAAEQTASWHGTGTVLVIDDDEGILEFAEATLQRAGLEVLLARDGSEGLELFRQHADEIQVVVLDRTMPTVGGDRVFQEIRRLRPGAAVILVSGYSEDRALDHMGKSLDAFLHKPFGPEELLDTIRRVVEAKSGLA